MKQSGCRTNLPRAVIFKSHRSASRSAFAGEIWLAATSPASLAQKSCGYWFSSGCSPGIQTQREQPILWPSGFRQKYNLRDIECCLFALKMRKVTYWRGGGMQVLSRGSSPMNCYIVSLTIWLIFYFSFPALPGTLVYSMWHNESLFTRFKHTIKLVFKAKNNLCTKISIR